MTSVATRRPRATKAEKMVVWQARMTAFFESRSASAPPSGPSASWAMPWAKTTKPTARLFPLRSNATTLWTTVDMKNAMKARSEPVQRMRKLRSANAAKVSRNQEPMCLNVQEM